MVSFDVVSLFTSVPVNEAFRVIEDLLAYDDTLRTQTTLLPADIMSLTRLCLTTTYFQFGGDFYKPVEGCVHELLPVTHFGQQLHAELVLRAEGTDNSPLKPSLWLRYMDNTFVIWNHAW